MMTMSAEDVDECKKKKLTRVIFDDLQERGKGRYPLG